MPTTFGGEPFKLNNPTYY
ncbi:hypothetical protein [Staphylococcus aureus]